MNMVSHSTGHLVAFLCSFQLRQHCKVLLHPSHCMSLEEKQNADKEGGASLCLPLVCWLNRTAWFCSETQGPLRTHKSCCPATQIHHWLLSCAVQSNQPGYYKLGQCRFIFSTSGQKGSKTQMPMQLARITHWNLLLRAVGYVFNR